MKTIDPALVGLLGYLPGELLTHEQTREERQLARLRDLLSRKTWSGRPNRHGMMPWPENVCILAGIDPEGIGDADENAFPFLTCALPFYGFPDGYPRDPSGRYALGEAVREHVGHLLGLNLESGPLKNAIEKVVGRDYLIPWLAAAQTDPTCKDLPIAKEYGRAATLPADRRGNGGRARAREKWRDRPEQIRRAYALFKEGRGLNAIHAALLAEFERGLHPGRWLPVFKAEGTPQDILGE